MFECRVKECHSNPDFSLVDDVGIAGIDGLLKPLLFPVNSQSPAAVVVAGEEVNEGTEAAPVKRTEAIEPAKQDESKSETANGTESREVSSEQRQDPRELLAKARTAVQLANDVYKQVEALANAPPRLSVEFIKSYYPIDPSDGHYTYCIICGLSGDVLCCDGCANVVHTHCVLLPVIPDGDWFCQDCAAQKPGVTAIARTSDDAGALEDKKETTESRKQTSASSSDPTTTPSKVSLADQVSHAKSTPTKTDSLNIDGQEGNNPAAVAALPSSSIGSEAKGLDSITTEKEGSSVLYPVSDSKSDEATSELSALLEELQSFHVKKAPETNGKPKYSKLEGANREAASGATVAGGIDLDLDGEWAETIVEREVRIPIGTVIKKYFEGLGSFKGRVVKSPTDEALFYGIRYEDGDEEDMTESELLDFLPLTEANKFLEKKEQSRKRGISTEPQLLRGRGRGRPRSVEVMEGNESKKRRRRSFNEVINTAQCNRKVRFVCLYIQYV
jgi:hypothetical protein